ncbi:hypothetical protein A6U86_11075 [Rhizobium sp. AC27/96]|uniref:hypothetical protein n=1 Tax=Rhizobium TaxID=379 RepID=UPI000827526D|nr:MULTISPECIES: hypothetical protein [Rhizobium]NTF45069.1 hypothetical protein [Rhizobium rhizogenes]OCJ07569.1 hypothetical protein A6U86_11075 [Rhizobium sp. AC27/96]
MSATKEQFFKKTASLGSDKATITDNAAKSIVAAENIAREKKTEALRALRLQQEANEEPKAAKPVKEKKKTVKRGRA